MREPEIKIDSHPQIQTPHKRRHACWQATERMQSGKQVDKKQANTEACTQENRHADKWQALTGSDTGR